MIILLLFILIPHFISGMAIADLLNPESKACVNTGHPLTATVNNAHNETNEIFCDLCNKKLKSSNSLLHHKQNKICQDKECPYCTAMFLKPKFLLTSKKLIILIRSKLTKKKLPIATNAPFVIFVLILKEC